jgi:uncharacterized membrane protein (DUF4010 family)
LYGQKYFRSAGKETDTTPNPLQFRSALQMAALFQVVLYVVDWVNRQWGQTGLLVSGSILGFTDVDALVLSMAKTAGGDELVHTAAVAVALGIMANNFLKLGITISFGAGRFRALAASGLGLLTLASGLTIIFLRKI